MKTIRCMADMQDQTTNSDSNTEAKPLPCDLKFGDNVFQYVERNKIQRTQDHPELKLHESSGDRKEQNKKRESKDNKKDKKKHRKSSDKSQFMNY